MSKYKNKQQLIDEIAIEKAKLLQLVTKVDEKTAIKPGACENWSIKDIINHLTEWQKMVLKWYEVGSKNQTPDVPGRSYKWSQLPELNNAIFEEYKNLTWEETQQLFKKTESEMMKFINDADEKTLLTPGLQPWMNKNTLIAYLGSCTASHYKWASNLIKKQLK